MSLKVKCIVMMFFLGGQLTAQEYFRLYRDFNHEQSDSLPIHRGQPVTIKNEQEGAFFRIDHSSSVIRYFYLEKGDSATFSYDSIQKNISFITAHPDLFQLTDQTSGAHAMHDLMKVFSADGSVEKIRLCDSIATSLLSSVNNLRNKYGSTIGDKFWDAETFNIVAQPISCLTYFSEDTTILHYMEDIFQRLKNTPQSSYAKMLNGSLSCDIPAYFKWRYPNDIQTPSGYYKVLINYFRPALADIMLVKTTIVHLEMTTKSADDVIAQAAKALEFIQDEQSRIKIMAARDTIVSKMQRLEQLGWAIFQDAKGINGSILNTFISKKKTTYLMITSPGCAPCVEASKWLAAHYDQVKQKADVYTIVVGGVERFKKEQEKSPYPWPVFYDESGEIYSQLPRRSVPQYFLVKDGQLIHQDAPKPQEYFGGVVKSKP